MKNKYLMPLAAAACLLASGAANALLVDDFSNGRVDLTSPSLAVQDSITESGVAAIGGDRKSTVGGDAQGGTSTLKSNDVLANAGVMAFGNDPNVQGIFSVEWFNIGPLDLNDWVGLTFEVINGSAGRFADFFVTVTDGGNDTSATSANLELAPGVYSIPFSGLAGSADLTDITSIELAGIANQDDEDFTFDNVTIEERVPLPGTLALLGLGLIGLRVGRFRRA